MNLGRRCFVWCLSRRGLDCGPTMPCTCSLPTATHPHTRAYTERTHPHTKQSPLRVCVCVCVSQTRHPGEAHTPGQCCVCVCVYRLYLLRSRSLSTHELRTTRHVSCCWSESQELSIACITGSACAPLTPRPRAAASCGHQLAAVAKQHRRKLPAATKAPRRKQDGRRTSVT